MQVALAVEQLLAKPLECATSAFEAAPELMTRSIRSFAVHVDDDEHGRRVEGGARNGAPGDRTGLRAGSPSPAVHTLSLLGRFVQYAHSDVWQPAG